MTRDDLRAQCIEAMVRGYAISKFGGYFAGTCARPEHLAALTAAFDALPTANARVVPVEATEEMIEAADPEGDCWFMERAVNRAISAGDLTNPQEKKP